MLYYLKFQLIKQANHTSLAVFKYLRMEPSLQDTTIGIQKPLTIKFDFDRLIMRIVNKVNKNFGDETVHRLGLKKVLSP